jgi:enhancing lycopene biosynthesis protein 2
MKKFAVVLAGCGVYDGAEIHEATLTLLAISKQGAEYTVFAPDMDQHHVINHMTGEEMKEKRNVLVEAARISRGKILSLDKFRAGEFDALIFPGGFGVAKNLCTFAFDGSGMKVHPDVGNAVKTMHHAKKPIGAMCISPVILAKLVKGATVTLGNDAEVIGAVEKMGAKHVTTHHGEVVRDLENKLFTTPCYMLDAAITDISLGTENIVREMLLMMQ